MHSKLRKRNGFQCKNKFVHSYISEWMNQYHQIGSGSTWGQFLPKEEGRTEGRVRKWISEDRWPGIESRRRFKGNWYFVSASLWKGCWLSFVDAISRRDSISRWTITSNPDLADHCFALYCIPLWIRNVLLLLSCLLLGQNGFREVADAAWMHG